MNLRLLAFCAPAAISLFVLACSGGSGGGSSPVDAADGSSSGTSGGSSTSDAGDAGPPPPVSESCAKLCEKKNALHCTADKAPEKCEPTCNESYAFAGCEPEFAALAACVAAGNVVCSVDNESTPVAPCGDDYRASAACLTLHPRDAGAD